MSSVLTPDDAPAHEPEAQLPEHPIPATERLKRPFRLGVVGAGAALGLFSRLAAANGFGDLNDTSMLLAASLTSALTGLGLLLMAAERDRFGPPLMWITAITAGAWGTLNWISPPFDENVTVWSTADQTVLAVLGLGNGLLLAGLVALAFVRRSPTLSVATALLAAVATLAANTLLLRNQWPAVVALGLAFSLVLLAWDRSPRREPLFVPPLESPRVSRAALSFASVALCGTALQLWISRTDIPRSIPGVILAVVLIAAAFASMIRVRREIERRETALSEWTSWMREIRKNDFRAEMKNFEPASTLDDPSIESGGQPPRKLSFPNLTITDNDLPSYLDTPATPAHPEVRDPELATELAQGAEAPALASATSTFSSLMETDTATASDPGGDPSGADLDAFHTWLTDHEIAPNTNRLIAAVEVMSLAEYDELPADDAAVATDEIRGFLADELPDAVTLAWIDGPYFLAAYDSVSGAGLSSLNRHMLKVLSSTDGMVAYVRPGPSATLDEVIDEAVVGLLRARQLQETLRS